VVINATDILQNLVYDVLHLETSAIALTYFIRMANTTNPGNLPHSLTPVFFPPGDPRTHLHGLELRCGERTCTAPFGKHHQRPESCLEVELVPDWLPV